MSSTESVTHWIRLLEAGDQAGARELWERYFQQLVRFARKKLRDNPRAVADEEDVALSAFDSFFRRAEEKRFPKLHGRDDLWQLLVLIAGRKAIKLMERENADRRGGKRARKQPVDADGVDPIERIIGKEPTPEFAALVAEEYQRLLDLLDDDDLRLVAVSKMEGFTNQEIAAKMDCVERTVERRLWAIRKLWEEEFKR